MADLISLFFPVKCPLWPLLMKTQGYKHTFYPLTIAGSQELPQLWMVSCGDSIRTSSGRNISWICLCKSSGRRLWGYLRKGSGTQYPGGWLYILTYNVYIQFIYIYIYTDFCPYFVTMLNNLIISKCYTVVWCCNTIILVLSLFGNFTCLSYIHSVYSQNIINPS